MKRTIIVVVVIMVSLLRAATCLTADYPKSSDYIRNDDTRNLARGDCDYIRDADKRYLCKGDCDYIRDRDLRELCKATKQRK